MKLRESLTRAAFNIAHSLPGRFIVGWVFAHLSFALPVRRIIETSEFIAFYHPRPSYKVHILIVPKRTIIGLQSLDEQHASLLLEVFHLAGGLIKKLDLDGKDAQLIVNGGAYQRIPQLHFHLVHDPVRVDTSRS
jgi:histidine triad (HIT) family protein